MKRVINSSIEVILVDKTGDNSQGNKKFELNAEPLEGRLARSFSNLNP